MVMIQLMSLSPFSMIPWFVFTMLGSVQLMASEPLRLVVEAGAHDRHQAIVPVSKPDVMPERPALADEDGNFLPIQVGDHGKLVFILPHLPAGESAVFELVDLAAEVEPRAAAVIDDGKVDFTVSGRHVTSYFNEPSPLPRENLDPVYKRGGYLWPVLTPEGRHVTDDFPQQHAHHHSIWMAWTRTEFAGRKPDFWNMGKGEGTVEVTGLGDTWSGPVHAGLVSRHRYVDLTADEPEAALQEQWTVRVYGVEDADSPYHLLELHAAQVTDGDEPLKLPKYHYGGLGVRGSAHWDGADGPDFLNSEGQTDRDEANGKPARWLFMGGDLDEGSAGIAVLSHPSNFRAPQPVRVHPNEPFICFAPQTDGGMAIEPGDIYSAHYRFVIVDGEADAELFERLWNDFAEPASARWVE